MKIKIHLGAYGNLLKNPEKELTNLLKNLNKTNPIIVKGDYIGCLEDDEDNYEVALVIKEFVDDELHITYLLNY